MKNRSKYLTQTGYASVLVLCGAVMTGCAGNSVKKNMTKPAVQPVAQVTPETETKANTPIIAEVKTMSQESATVNKQSPDSELKFPDIDISEKTQPKQLAFYFGFDKASLEQSDIEVIKQHARFMLENPGLILQISGHTDQHGPREYNEYLSKKRADEVAKILIAEGVTESQLVINALASDSPLAGETDKRKNRRVELEYQELNLVSKQ